MQRTFSGPCDVESNAMNVQPLLFNETHGPGIQLSADRRRAIRFESTCKTTCFSNRPVCINEIVSIKVCDASTTNGSFLRFGVTDFKTRVQCTPSTIVNKGAVFCMWVTIDGDVIYGVENERNYQLFNAISTSSSIWVLIDLCDDTTSVEFVGELILTLQPTLVML